MMVASSVLLQVESDLVVLSERLARLADSRRHVPCVARTLTQQAMPTTLGFRAAGWLAGVHDALLAVRSCRPLPVSLGGPVGTAAVFGESGPAVVASVAERLGLEAPVVSWHTRRSPVLSLASTLVAVGEACGRMCADLLLMAQTEVGEASDGSAGASSAMAHKANPTRAVLVAAAVRQLPFLLGSVASSGAAASERPAGEWHAEWQPLRTMMRLAGAAAERTCALADDMSFDELAMRRNLDRLVDAVGRGPGVGHLADRAPRRVDRPGAGTSRAGRRMTVSLAHRVDGPDTAPVVVLGPSLGTTWEMWDSLASTLATSHRVVRYDTRGHGRSPVPEGPYDVAGLASDVLSLLDSLDVDRFALVGLSLGGAIGQTLALTQPSRLTAAVLCCTVPWFGGPAPWEERAARVRSRGMSAIKEATPARWFTDEFRSSLPDEVDRHIAMLTSIDPVGYASCCEALGGFDVRESLPEITVPVRVIAGGHDPVAVPDACEEMTAAIPGADLVVLPDTSHIATVAGEPFERAVTEHLERHL